MMTLYPLLLTVVGWKLIHCASARADLGRRYLQRACVWSVWQWLTKRNDTAERRAVIKEAPSIVRKRKEYFEDISLE